MGANFFKKKALPMTLTASMAFSATPVLAASNDLDGHWAENVITEWQDKGLIKGYADGTFKPNNSITRAEFITLLNHAWGFTEKASVSFQDVKETDWFYEAVAQALSAGYTKGYADGTFQPNKTITRAEAAVMMANALGLSANESSARFTDAAEMPAWAQDSVRAVVAAGIMSGHPDGSFGATKSITRAEAVSALNRIEAGQAEQATPNFIITEPDTTISDATIEGNLVIAASVGEGAVYLNNVDITGELCILGGGKDAIHCKDVTVDFVTIFKPDIGLVLEGDTQIGTVSIYPTEEETTKDAAEEELTYAAAEITKDAAEEGLTYAAKKTLTITKNGSYSGTYDKDNNNNGNKIANAPPSHSSNRDKKDVNPELTQIPDVDNEENDENSFNPKNFDPKNTDTPPTSLLLGNKKPKADGIYLKDGTFLPLKTETITLPTRTETTTTDDSGNTITTITETDGNGNTTVTVIENRGGFDNMENETKTITETKNDGTVIVTKTETSKTGSLVNETKTVTETKNDGTVTETVTETRSDFSETVTRTISESTTKKDGNTITKITKKDGIVTETITDTVTGSTTETVTDSSNGTVTETVTDKMNGTVTQTVIKDDGSITRTETVTQYDGIVTVTETKTDGKTGTITKTTTQTVTDAETGTVTETTTETETITKSDGSKIVTVTSTDAETGTVTKTVTETGTEATFDPQSGKMFWRETETITETVTKKDGTVTKTVTDKDGNVTKTVTDKDGNVSETMTNEIPLGDITSDGDGKDLPLDENLPGRIDLTRDDAKKIFGETYGDNGKNQNEGSDGQADKDGGEDEQPGEGENQNGNFVDGEGESEGENQSTGELKYSDFINRINRISQNYFTYTSFPTNRNTTSSFTVQQGGNTSIGNFRSNVPGNYVLTGRIDTITIGQNPKQYPQGTNVTFNNVETDYARLINSANEMLNAKLQNNTTFGVLQLLGTGENDDEANRFKITGEEGTTIEELNTNTSFTAEGNTEIGTIIPTDKDGNPTKTPESGMKITLGSNVKVEKNLAEENTTQKEPEKVYTGGGGSHSNSDAVNGMNNHVTVTVTGVDTTVAMDDKSISFTLSEELTYETDFTLKFYYNDNPVDGTSMAVSQSGKTYTVTLDDALAINPGDSYALEIVKAKSKYQFSPSKIQLKNTSSSSIDNLIVDVTGEDTDIGATDRSVTLKLSKALTLDTEVTFTITKMSADGNSTSLEAGSDKDYTVEHDGEGKYIFQFVNEPDADATYTIGIDCGKNYVPRPDSIPLQYVANTTPVAFDQPSASTTATVGSPFAEIIAATTGISNIAVDSITVDKCELGSETLPTPPFTLKFSFTEVNGLSITTQDNAPADGAGKTYTYTIIIPKSAITEKNDCFVPDDGLTLTFEVTVSAADNPTADSATPTVLPSEQEDA